MVTEEAEATAAVVVDSEARKRFTIDEFAENARISSVLMPSFCVVLNNFLRWVFLLSNNRPYLPSFRFYTLSDFFLFPAIRSSAKIEIINFFLFIFVPGSVLLTVRGLFSAGVLPLFCFSSRFTCFCYGSCVVQKSIQKKKKKKKR